MVGYKKSVTEIVMTEIQPVLLNVACFYTIAVPLIVLTVDVIVHIVHLNCLIQTGDVCM